MSNRIQGLAGPYRRNPGLLMPELEAVKAFCDKCGASNKIDWLADMEFPRQPIVANDGGVWIPITFPVDCSCGNTIDFETPKKPVNGGRTFYGDEAHRVVNTKWGEVSFFCITLMGLHPDRREEFNHNLLGLKTKLKPKEDPESWTYHATSIWSTHSDKQVYNLKSVAEKVAHARAFAKLIRETRPHITSINVSSAIRLSKDKEVRSAELKTQKEDILKQATLTSLEVIRKNSMSINWVFDNVKDSTNGEKTEGWADECFLGLQHSRQFIYLTAQANIQKPTFVRPGSHYLLEAADFMSFWVAREFFRLINKQAPEIKCALMGKGLYQVTDSKGDAELMTCNGSEAIRQYFKPQR